MKAHENVAMYCVFPKNTVTRRMKDHKKRLKDTKPFILPPTEPRKSPRSTSPSKLTDEIKPGTQAYVAKHNLVLAKRIFEIMEGPGIISNIMEKNANENHPGTINFPHRLAVAKRIHQENLAMASRLDSVKAYYDSKTLASLSMSKHNKTSPRKIKLSPRENSLMTNGTSDQHGRIILGKNALQINSNLHFSTLPFQQSSQSQSQTGTETIKRSKHVLLEYTKIQKGRVLDVAVIKEPFRDNYCIFGIDIDNGQRYELKLSSEEVSNILEGDILVTSVDNVEVWMTLLTKIELKPVDNFAKIPLPAPPTQIQSSFSSSLPSESAYQKINDHQTSSIYLEDENTENISMEEVGPQTDSPKNFKTPVQKTQQSQQISSSNQSLNFPDIIDDISDYNGSSSITFQNNTTTNNSLFTLDEYYENNIQLTPLPTSLQQSLHNNTDNPIILNDDNMRDIYNERPSARSASRDKQNSTNSSNNSIINTNVNLLNIESKDINKEVHNIEEIKKYSINKVNEFINSALSNIKTKQQSEKQTSNKNEGENNKQKSTNNSNSNNNNNNNNTKDNSHDRKKSVANNTNNTNNNNNTVTGAKRLSVTNTTAKNNPYRATKVTSNGGRSHSIRYTTEESSTIQQSTNTNNTNTSTNTNNNNNNNNVSATSTTTTTTTTTAGVVHQPAPPSEAPSTKQQTGQSFRKQSVNNNNNNSNNGTNTHTSAGRKQSETINSLRSRASSITPNKPAEVAPPSRRPSKQTNTNTKQSSASSPNKTNIPSNNNDNSQPISEVVVACMNLAQLTTNSIIETAQSNIEKLLKG